MTNSLLYIAVARTATHVGCGQGLDDIDLPLLRGKASGLPIFGSGGVKGVLKQHAPTEWACSSNEVVALFGPDRNNAGAHAGMLAPQDARLLAMPVASLRGGWAWVTCPDALRRFRRDAVVAAGLTDLPDMPPVPGRGHAAVVEATPLRMQIGNGNLLALGEKVFSLGGDNAQAGAQSMATWGAKLAMWSFPDDDDDWRAAFAQRLVLVGDDDFRYFTITATEQRARVSLNVDRVATENALWREECLPADSLLWGLISASPVAHGLREAPVDEQTALDKVKKCNLQMGGKASVGYGNVQFLPIRTAA